MAAVESKAGAKGLRRGAIGLTSGVVIGLASAAPAYSLAASLGVLVVLVGEKAPAVMLVAFVPMVLIAVAYKELNKAEPDCGTTFTWAGRAFGPWVGWMGGWTTILACIICLASLAQTAGAYTFYVLGLNELGDSMWATAVGVVWIVLMTWLSYRGVEVSARLQAALLSVELILLAILTQLALVKVLSGDAIGRAADPQLAWLWPGGLGVTQLVDAVLIAVFLYWGWDSAVSVNEESDKPRVTPGRAAVLSTALLVVTYGLVAFAAVAFAGTAEDGIGLANPENADDVFVVLGTAIFGDNALGRLLEGLLVFSVLTSAAASTQTTVLPSARSALAMGSYQALPSRFARIHPRFLTPSFATWAVGLLAAGYYAFLTAVSSDVLSDSIAAIGLLIGIYYSLTGFACVWYYRRRLHGRDMWTKGLLPGLGAVLLLVACVLSVVDYAVPAEDETAVFGIGGTFVVGIGTLLLGAVIMILYSRLAPEFFRGTTLSRQAADSDALPRHGVTEKAGTTSPTTAFDDAPAVTRTPILRRQTGVRRGAERPSGDGGRAGHHGASADRARASGRGESRTEPVALQELPKVVMPARRRTAWPWSSPTRDCSTRAPNRIPTVDTAPADLAPPGVRLACQSSTAVASTSTSRSGSPRPFTLISVTGLVRSAPRRAAARATPSPSAGILSSLQSTTYSVELGDVVEAPADGRERGADVEVGLLDLRREIAGPTGSPRASRATCPARKTVREPDATATCRYTSGLGSPSGSAARRPSSPPFVGASVIAVAMSHWSYS